MSEFYFSDRERGARQRTEEMIPPKVWGALCRLITGKIDDDSFGFKFPAMCPDGAGPCGCDARSFRVILTAEIPELDEEQPLDPSHLPETAIILDLLEFCAQAVAKPVYGSFHSFFAHHHLDFDRETGLVDFVTSVNRLFARNGIAFELSPDGQARRLAPTGLREELAAAVFHTGDRETDKLLEIARRRILSQHPDDRQDALEKIWDAFERIKTLEPGDNKRDQAAALLNRTASTPKMRQSLDNEAKALTEIGNSLRIRHAETTQEKLERPEHVDYLFHRMLSFLRLVLRSTGRGG